MDNRRFFLYAALALIIYSLWNSWQIEHPFAQVDNNKDSLQTIHSDRVRVLPEMSPTKNTHLSVDDENSSIHTADGKAKIVYVKTDVLDLGISLQHGDIVEAKLLHYPVSVDNKNQPFALLQNNSSERYLANSSLFQVTDETINNINFEYTTTKPRYSLSDGQDKLTVTLTGKSLDGLTVNKEFIFSKGSYLIDIRYLLTNDSSSLWKGYMNTQLFRSSPQEDKSSMFHIGSYTGASYSNPGQHRYKKVDFKDMSKHNLDVDVKSGWFAMQQHYFLTAWIPTIDSKSRFYTHSEDGSYTIGAVSEPIIADPGKTAQISSRLYIGPEITNTLSAIAPGLDQTVDYGWLWFLSSMLFSLMKFIYSALGNWGWSIVMVTMLIKLGFYRLSATSYKSMAAMRKLQPKLMALRERYGDDKAKISQATMELYRQEKVNPLGGCLPIVIQIPVFIALYWVLLESVELRQAPFILWINDLAAADYYHVLPVIMGLTMFIQQRLNPAPPDPMQAKVMMFLPILFTGLFWNFPSGLVLYWIVNNTLSILQQWYITRQYSDGSPEKKMVAVK